jgi:hypothetical protein
MTAPLTAHARMDLAVERVLAARGKLLARWDHVLIERSESLRHPDQASFVVETFQERDAADAASLFAPIYKVQVRLDEDVFCAELIVCWVSGEDSLARAEQGPAKDVEDMRAQASYVAGLVVGWLLLPTARLRALEKAAVRRETE